MADPGEGERFAERLAAELPALVRLATRLLRDSDVAEDCAQETLVGAWRRRDQLRDPAALAPWLRRSLVNRVIDRSRSRHDELDIDQVESDWKDDAYSVRPDLVLDRAELRDELEDALARLPVIYRVPVVLHDALGWTAVEIASAMSVGLPATKQRLRRGRMMLVSALAEDDARRRASLAQPMRCWRARRHVSAYMDGELDQATKAAVEDHLATCPTCPPLYAGLVGVRAGMGGLRDPDTVIEAAIAARIRDALAAEGAGVPVGLGENSGMTEHDERRRAWDRRHAEREHIESGEPDPVLVREAGLLPPGRALDLACGDGRNAVWLARQGWQVTAVDFSSVALDRGRRRAAEAEVEVDWQAQDLLAWTPPEGSFDLVSLVYLHLPPDERRLVLQRAARALAPGGRLLVVGHHQRNMAEGVGGPQDPRVLYTEEEIVAEVPGVVVERAEALRASHGGRPRVDAVVVARRASS